MTLQLKKIFSFLVIIASLSTLGLHAQNSVINIKALQPVAEIQPTMWGVFFEDINMGADGGIYAELIKNRSFEFYKPLMGWKIERKTDNEGDITVQNRQENNVSNPRFIHVKLNNLAKGDLGITNEGFKGMGIKKGIRYDFSVLFRLISGTIKIHAELLDEGGKVVGEAIMTPTNLTKDWKKEAISFTAKETVAKGKFRIWFEGNGEIDLDIISLFPEDTWKKRPGGMRADMVQLLADMKPGFIRFPGGCIVEGFDLSQRYQWKKTIGPIEDRQLIINRWNAEFAHRPSPDYFQTFGLGFFEYFQLAEDIGAEPLPILNCGMACQFNSAELVPIDQLQPYIQDAVDLVEFANGDITTKWGKIRAEMGHPAPFNLKMIGIGNENWGPQYVERLKLFTKAMKEKYPTIKLVNSSGTDPMGNRFDYLNKELRAMNADIIDEHYYRTPDWFLKNAGRYDSYDRHGSKVFAGEYAAQSDRTVSIANKNNWKCALSEAAFMTGLERNAQVVTMASYAPLFAHAEGWQWTPDLIWVDNLRSYGTPNYYVQKLYSTNKGTHVLTTTENGAAIIGQDSIYVSSVLNKPTNEIIIKVANVSTSSKTREINLEGVKNYDTKARIITLKNTSLDALNSFENATNVSPNEQELILQPKGKISLTFAPNSFTVFRIKIL